MRESAREREPDLPRKDQKGGRGNTGNVWQRVATCWQRVATCGNVFLSRQITRNQRESTTFNDFQRESTTFNENQRKSDQNGVAPKPEPPKYIQLYRVTNTQKSLVESYYIVA
jgi:hypothetical protein